MQGIIDVDVLVYKALAVHIKDGLPPAEVTQVFDSMLKRVEQDAACDNYSYHLSGQGNFRKNLKQGFTKYKGNRTTKPELYNFLRNYIEKTYDCITVPLFEADDTAAIEATELRKKGELYTLITVDKDWQQVGGIWFNTTYRSVKAISQKDGLKFFNRQLLIGDTVDNIPGLKAIGPKKAEAALKELSLIEEVEVIEKMYDKVHKENGQEILNHMGTMLWLKRSYDEPHWTSTNYKEFLNEIEKNS